MSLKKIIMPAVLLLALSLTGCGGSKKANTDTGADIQSVDQDENSALSFDVNGDSDAGKAGALQTVNFPFNSAQITSLTKDALDANVDFLKENPGVQVQVEGHCDERGGVQYNIALGENRANTVKEYLVTLGIDSGRISTISFGKERPVSFGHAEDAWGQNRRANFVITAK